MSNDTEVKILEELKNINGEIQNINGEIQNINGEIKDMNTRLDKIDTRLDEHDDKFNTIDLKLDYTSKKLVDNDFKLSLINNVLKGVSNSTTVMEHEHGLKIDAIYEQYSENTKSHKSFDEKLSNILDKIDVHTWEIEDIKKKIS